jgi:hypothetical protein
MKFLTALNGSKTYLLALAAAITAGAGYWSGDLTLTQALTAFFGSGAIAALRHGISGSVITIAEELLPAVLKAVADAQKPAAKMLLAALLFGATLSACTTQPIEAQIATACNQIVTAYRSATILGANGKLSVEAIAAFRAAEPLAMSACDPSNPPTNLQAALNNATMALNALALANAGVH